MSDGAPGWPDRPSGVRTGRLTDRVPVTGEDFHPLAEVGGVRVEHIVSSAAPETSVQVQHWDEWVVVLAGGARLEVAGQVIPLAAREWLLLPAGTPHRVLGTEPGTQWIAVHGDPPATTVESPIAGQPPTGARGTHPPRTPQPAVAPPWPEPWPEPGQSIDDVVSRLSALAEGLPAGDGVRAFTDMYRETTRQVAEAAGQKFADRAFLERLDVNFAHLYFAALQAHGADPRSAPRCWATLISARARAGVSPLQCALVGMNAHITYDLPRALVRTAAELRGGLDDALGTLDDRLSMWAIEQAREGAWISARALWALGDTAGARRYVAGLDRMVALTSRALLAL